MFLRNNCAVEVLSTSPVCRHGCRISLVPGLGMDGSQVLVCWLAVGRSDILSDWIAWPSPVACVVRGLLSMLKGCPWRRA